MTVSTATRSRVGIAFIARLRSALGPNTALAAQLRREAGTPLGQSRVQVEWYGLMSHGPAELQRDGPNEIAFLVSTLFAHDRNAYRLAHDPTTDAASDAVAESSPEPGSPQAPSELRGLNVGGALGRLVRAGDPAKDPLARRLIILLDSSLEPDGGGSLPWRLRHTLSLLRSRTSGPRPVLDWGRLLDDLLLWNHPERFVQRDWARSFYRLVPVTPDDPASAGEAATL